MPIWHDQWEITDKDSFNSTTIFLPVLVGFCGIVVGGGALDEFGEVSTDLYNCTPIIMITRIIIPIAIPMNFLFIYQT